MQAGEGEITRSPQEVPERDLEHGLGEPYVSRARKSGGSLSGGGSITSRPGGREAAREDEKAKNWRRTSGMGRLKVEEQGDPRAAKS